PTGIDIADADDIARAQVFTERLLAAEVAGEQGQITDDETRGPDWLVLLILAVGAGIADMRISESHHLLGIRGVGENLLIAGHGGIENHLAGGQSFGTNGGTSEQAAIF